MNELGNTPADKDYKPSGIVNNLAEGQVKAVQLTDGTYITEKLAKSMTKAESFAMQYGFYDKEKKHACCVGYNAGYKQAEKDLALTPEDIKLITKIHYEIVFKDTTGIKVGDVASEVLKRYLEAKK